MDETIPLAGSKRTEFDFGEFDHSKIPFEKEEWPAVIIGSSMVGMMMGVVLGYHGQEFRIPPLFTSMLI